MNTTTPRKSQLIGSGEIDVSFEFFPPKTEKMEESLWPASGGSNRWRRSSFR